MRSNKITYAWIWLCVDCFRSVTNVPAFPYLMSSLWSRRTVAIFTHAPKWGSRHLRQRAHRLLELLVMCVISTKYGGACPDCLGLRAVRMGVSSSAMSVRSTSQSSLSFPAIVEAGHWYPRAICTAIALRARDWRLQGGLLVARPSLLSAGNITAIVMICSCSRCR